MAIRSATRPGWASNQYGATWRTAQPSRKGVATKYNASPGDQPDRSEEMSAGGSSGRSDRSAYHQTGAASTNPAGSTVQECSRCRAAAETNVQPPENARNLVSHQCSRRPT